MKKKNYILGAVCGDVAGSIYEFMNMANPAGFKKRPAVLVEKGCQFTDDTVFTCAVAEGILECKLKEKTDDSYLYASIRHSLIKWGKKYTKAGFSNKTRAWFTSEDPQPYGSLGNGSAMRASYAGWFASSLQEAEKFAEMSALPTHNHIDGVTGAKVVAGSIYLLREGKSKEEIEKYVSQYYDMNFTLDEIRESYTFQITCPTSVPQAIRAFIEGESFEDTLSLAISIGGDSDTIAAIAGSLAEVIYPISTDLEERVLAVLPDDIKQCLAQATEYIIMNSGTDSSFSISKTVSGE